ERQRLCVLCARAVPDGRTAVRCPGGCNRAQPARLGDRAAAPVPARTRGTGHRAGNHGNVLVNYAAEVRASEPYLSALVRNLYFSALALMFAILILRIFLYEDDIYKRVLRSDVLVKAGLISYARDASKILEGIRGLD